VLEPGEAVTGTLAFLEESGERRVEVEADSVVEFAFDDVQGRVRLATAPLEDGLVRVAMCVHNTTEVPDGLTRSQALRSSLRSTHLVVRAPGGRFASPVSPGPAAAPFVARCEHVNIFPVLATDADDIVLGATIVLPDHPQIAPESHGDLFDATEIEEALLLHVLALSDDERAAIAEQDPKVREMLARAEAEGPDALKRLHGRVTVTDLPPMHRPGPADVAGEPAVEIGGVTFRRGAKVRLRPGPGAAPQDGVWTGRVATIERIYRDYEDGVHLAVTVDDDPGQELMRDIGRYLYFKPAEVEVVPA
jgi:hypothetical protein